MAGVPVAEPDDRQHFFLAAFNVLSLSRQVIGRGERDDSAHATSGLAQQAASLQCACDGGHLLQKIRSPNDGLRHKTPQWIGSIVLTQCCQFGLRRQKTGVFRRGLVDPLPNLRERNGGGIRELGCLRRPDGSCDGNSD